MFKSSFIKTFKSPFGDLNLWADGKQMIKRSIPNLLTCMNLLCGCLAIIEATKPNFTAAAFLVVLAAIFDFFDGFFARALNVKSEIGAQLDSLADMVSFGIVPSIIAFELLSTTDIHPFLSYIPFSIAIFSAIRLAKFNIDDRQTTSFIGLPTPANALFWISIPLIIYMILDNDGEAFWSLEKLGSKVLAVLYNQYFLIGASILSSFMMVVNLPLFGLKFEDYSWENNKIRYTFLVLSIVLLIPLRFIAIPLIIVLYILFSILNTLTSR